MDTTSRLLWEVLPLILAMVTILYCGFRFLVTDKHSVRIDSAMSIVTTFIMVAAQVSWSWTLFIKKDLLGTDLANVMWTLFNTLVMLKFMYTAYWNRKS